MSDRADIQVRGNDVNGYATGDDFCRIFDEGLNGLYQLSFLLTGDHRKAEQCFVAGIEDCVKANHVFREWARSWAKRVIFENAIRELKPRPNHYRSSPSATFCGEQSSGSGGRFKVDAVLGLGDFERFVFVMSVLENYPDHECALLLGCSILEIREGRVHALEELAGSG
jgi:hypothetical protein